MNVNITARHFKAPERLRDFTESELNRLSKFYDNIIDCEVIMDYVKPNNLKQKAEIHLRVYGQVLTVSATSEDMFKSVDLAVKKLERQLKKYKGRLRSFQHEKAVKRVVVSEFSEEE